MKRVYFLFFIFLFIGCSLNYDDDSKKENNAPQFIFEKPIFSRYENQKLSLKISANTIERYKTNSSIFAQDLQFEQFNADQDLQTKGKCGLFSVDQNNGIYLLFDNIELFSKEHSANFFADYLKWNSNTEQLVGSKRDTVRIEKDDVIIFGTGFSASQISNTYKFSGTVTGTIETKEEQSTLEQE